jgi:hypothetical protein
MPNVWNRSELKQEIIQYNVLTLNIIKFGHGDLFLNIVVYWNEMATYHAKILSNPVENLKIKFMLLRLCHVQLSACGLLDRRFRTESII